MKRCTIALPLFLLGGLAAPAASLAQNLYLVDGRIVDPESREVRRGNLLIVDGRIAGAPPHVPPDFAGETVELEGHWVIPGLVDLHVHSYGNMAPGGIVEGLGSLVTARRMLYAGATGFLDLFGLEPALYASRERLRSGESAGAELFISASCLTAPEGHCTEYGIPTRTMASPEEARSHVRELAAKQADVIKIVYARQGRMPSIDRATLAAAVETAREHGLPTVIHVGSWEDVQDGVDLGASAVTHVPDDEPIPAGMAERMAERGVASIPTLAVQTDLREFILDPGVLERPLAVALASEGIRAAYRTDSLAHHAAEWKERAETRRARTLEAVKQMAEAGVSILAGTDAGNWGTIQGFSLHRELEKLVAAGLSPWDALAAATTRAGDFLGRRFGVQPGDEANLVVLDASPIEEIRNTQAIVQVIQRGIVVQREALLESS